MTIVVASGVSAVENPVTFLARLRERLAPGGVLVMAQPTIEGPKGGRIARSSQRWAMPARWHFTRHTLHLTLLRAGYQRVWIRNEAAGRLLVSAEVATPRALPRLSVIVPVFNEASTCATLLDRLFANELTGIEQEIVIVESNSTDGTRAIVERYRSYPGARVVLEDRPRGKGHAVRSGLAHATGEIVLIQDADLEYDIEDYPLLLQPLLDWQTLFVLGSRHAGDWKLRVFNDAPLTATIFNLGHVFYTWLVNTSLQTEMTDPFTMFKVFRRDCLHGLAFEGRRFDFDFELVMKLVRKGYVPRELPVNYTARSFSEGKKVSFFRDGLSWVWTVVKFRVGALGPGDADRF
jgi:glycosyltransferase involved in cell wall biosynthesis